MTVKGPIRKISSKIDFKSIVADQSYDGERADKMLVKLPKPAKTKVAGRNEDVIPDLEVRLQMGSIPTRFRIVKGLINTLLSTIACQLYQAAVGFRLWIDVEICRGRSEKGPWSETQIATSSSKGTFPVVECLAEL
jgi:hypothetical protein